MKRNARPFHMHAHVHRIVWVHRGPPDHRVVLVAKVLEVKEVKVAQLVHWVLVENQAHQDHKDFQARKDPTGCLFQENQVGKD